MSEQQNNLNKLTQIEQETKCSICTGLFHDPHLLNCGHCFCGGCIIHWFQQKKCCPKCREPAIRQPIQAITLQKICDILRPDNVIQDKKLTRSDWEVLYPVANQSTFIRDEDQDGIIHRCSNCGWELDEENYCGNCRIHYDNGSVVNDNESDYNMQSDAGSHLEEENEEDYEDLSGFVVDNDQIEYENLPEDDILDDGSELPPIEVSSSEDEEMEHVVRKNRKRRRVINDSEDEGSHLPITIADEDNDEEVSHRRNSIVVSESEEEESHTYHRNSAVFSAGEEEEMNEEETEDDEVEYADDPFERTRCKYIDDYASEDDDEEETKPKPVKVDPLLESIVKAQEKMSNQPVSKQSVSKQSVSSSSEDSDDESADYNL